MKLNLILGVQNNNKDEIHQRVKIKNCSKITIKTLFFPSMKTIIFEAIYQILLKTQTSLTFNHKVIDDLVEAMNISGMSVDKFKRIIKTYLTETFYNHDLFFLHIKDSHLRLKKCNVTKEENLKAIRDILENGVQKYFSDSIQELKQLCKECGLKKEENSDIVDFLLDQIKQYMQMRRKWLKAYELLEFVMLKASGAQGKEQDIFRYQFLLNYLNQKPQKRMEYIMEQLTFVDNFQEFLLQTIIPEL